MTNVGQMGHYDSSHSPQYYDQMYKFGKGKNINNDNNKAKQLIKTQIFVWSLKHLTAYMKLTVTGSK